MGIEVTVTVAISDPDSASASNSDALGIRVWVGLYCRRTFGEPSLTASMFGFFCVCSGITHKCALGPNSQTIRNCYGV